MWQHGFMFVSRSTALALAHAVALAPALALALTAGCGGDSGPGDADAAPLSFDATPVVVPDAAADAQDLPDGLPTRVPCTNNLGAGLTTEHGRLDGTLVALVQPGANGCNGDADHLHLQVLMNGSTYDVAINVSDPNLVYFAERDLALPGIAWSEGWHANPVGALDYVGLGLHAVDFTPTAKAALAAQITSELADANHISVYMTGYGPDGGHNVHRRGLSVDGAIVIRPLSATPHQLFFHFANQNF